jgi:aryl-alcohol dehydrogenase-like predicted oxidoreductase
MRTQRLGTHGPELSVIGFGAMEVGETEDWDDQPSDDVLLDVIRSAPDVGINWIDTAEIYGAGNSERLVGMALSGGRRDDVFIATKVAPDDGGTGFRPEQVRAACDASLKRLQTDWIDLYQLHWWPEAGEDVPIEETWGTMSELVNEGKVRFVGVSNFNQGQMERCLAVRHVDSLQPQFAMVNPRLAELIRWCGEQGIGVISYGPLGYGVFRPSVLTEEDVVEILGEETTVPKRRAIVEQLRGVRPIADRIGIPMSQLALAWNVQQPGVTSAIAGSTNPVHIRENAEAGDVVLDATTMVELDALVQRFQAALNP